MPALPHIAASITPPVGPLHHRTGRPVGGYVEAWVGEHFTLPWEPICAPDLLFAQALLRTKRIKLAPGAHLCLTTTGRAATA